MARILAAVTLKKYLARVVARAPVYVQNRHAIANEMLLKTLVDGVNRPPDRGRVVAGRYAHEEVHLADAHELTKKAVIEKSFFRQAFGAPKRRCQPR